MELILEKMMIPASNACQTVAIVPRKGIFVAHGCHKH